MTHQDSPQVPHDLPAEQAVIGALLIDPGAIHRLNGALAPSDFYQRAHRVTFATALTLRERGVPLDIITLAEELERRGTLGDAGGLAYLGGIARDTPSAANILAYAAIVTRHAQTRRLLQALSDASAALYARTDPAVVITEVLALLTVERKTAPTNEIFTAADLAGQHFPPVKWAVPGLIPEGLAILAGKPKMGKSWLALSLGIAIASGGTALGKIKVPHGDVLYLALEDSTRRLKSRLDTLLDPETGATYPNRLHMATTWPRAREGMLALSMWLDTHPDCRLVVIDTLAKIRPPAGKGGDTYSSDYSDIGAIQSLASKHGVAILLVHHLRKMVADDVMDTVSGTLGLTGAADGMMVLKRERGQADAVLHVTGRDVEDAEHALRWDAPTCSWMILGDIAQFRMSKERQEILAVLADGPKFPKAVAEALGKRRDAVRYLMSQMARAGELVSLGGLYTISALPKDVHIHSQPSQPS